MTSVDERLRRGARTDVSRSAVLARLGAVGPESRAGLADALQLSAPLITRLVRDLIEDGLIAELDPLPSRSGRPAGLLKLTGHTGVAIGVTIDRTLIAMVEVGLDGTVIRSAHLDFAPLAPGSRERLVTTIRTFVAQASTPLLGVGVGVPGKVDDQSNGTVDALHMGWSEEPLGESLRSALDAPVLVENSVNALAIAERLYGAARNLDHFVVVTTGLGIGGAAVVNGQMQRGYLGRGGDIGHASIVEGGRPCICGNRGCLETYSSSEGLVLTAQERGLLEASSDLSALLDPAYAGAPDAQAIFSEAAHLLGRAVATVVQVVAPEAVIIQGEATLNWRLWQSSFDDALRSALPAQIRGIRVVIDEWQEEVWAKGAAALVLATPFAPIVESGAQGAAIRQRFIWADRTRTA